MVINGRSRCAFCMRLLKEDGSCGTCGLEQEKYSPLPRCLTPGTVLADRYVTGQVLGEGSFGITYIGWDTVMEIPVAVKEHFPDGMVSRDMICGSDASVSLYENDKKEDYEKSLEKFMNEAKCLSRFNRVKGIVSVRDFFYENNTAYIIMQHIEGMSARQFVEKKGKLDAGLVLEKMRPVLHALQQVHGSGIVHRDISPDNMVVTESGEFVLIDFGAARLCSMDSARTMTVMFKQGYSPAEQYQTKGKWGPYTDVYSISATMYYMITGKPPADSVTRMLTDEMPSLISMKDINLTVSQKQALMKGLAVEVRKRWQTIRELGEALYGEDTFDGDVCETKGKTGLQTYSGRTPNKRKRTWLAGIWMAAAAAGICVWMLARGNPGMPETANGQISYSAAEHSETKKAASVSGTAIQQETVPETKTVKVPELVGMKGAKARKKLKQLNLKCALRWVTSDTTKGTVLKQSVRSGEEVEPGTKVTLKVSRGKPSATPRPKTENGGSGDKAGGGTTKTENGFAGIIE